MKKNLTKESLFPSLKEAKQRTRNASNIIYASNEVSDYIKNIGKNRNYYIRTYGCQANERDSEVICGILESLGYQKTEDYENADLILLNTCAIRQNAEDKVFGEIGFLKKLKVNNPDLILGVCGCMAQEESVINKILSTHQHVDLVFGTHNIHNLPNLLFNAITSKEKVIEVYSKEGEVVENLPSVRNHPFKAWVNIMYGCDKFCTYCIVPYTRGKERSRLLEDVVKEVKDLVARGYKEVTLLGQNVNSYGKDLKMENGFAKLLEAVAQTNIKRLRFTTSHPYDFTEEVVDVISKYDNIMPFIHLPVQSGNSEILKLMGRRYTIEQYLHLFDLIKAKVKNCAFSTDIIVGFPNETEEQFQDTLKLVDHCKFDNAFTFIYSPREGTPAAKMQDNVSFEDKQDRLARLNKKVNDYVYQNNQKYLNQEVEVLVDGFSKKNKDVYSGYTETMKLVNFIGKDCKQGDIVKVRITNAKTFTLDGEQV